MVETPEPQDTEAAPLTSAQAAAILARVPVTEDVIEYTIACALALSPPPLRSELRTLIATRASVQSRKIFGGDRVYINRRLGEGSSERNAAIKRDYWERGEHIPLLERRYSLSASHLWRIIKS
jgi:hypothetical protein